MQRVHMDDIDIDESERHLLGGAPFTGEIVETDRAGAVVELCLVSDGWEDGPQRAWYSNGHPKHESTMRRGVPVGASRDWYEDGVLAVEREFDDAGRLLATRRWDEEGRLLADHRH